MVEAASRRVIVADRDRHVRRLLERTLLDAGFEVEFADDGYAALDRSRLAPPELVVAEALLPRLDGLALCRLLKSDAVTAGTRVVIMSVLEWSERAGASGADGFLQKPLESSRIAACVRAADPHPSGAPGAP